MQDDRVDLDNSCTQTARRFVPQPSSPIEEGTSFCISHKPVSRSFPVRRQNVRNRSPCCVESFSFLRPLSDLLSPYNWTRALSRRNMWFAGMRSRFAAFKSSGLRMLTSDALRGSNADPFGGCRNGQRSAVFTILFWPTLDGSCSNSRVCRSRRSTIKCHLRGYRNGTCAMVTLH
jgi:hypothetical protein